MREGSNPFWFAAPGIVMCRGTDIQSGAPAI
jgi:hypothetical protein